MIARKNAELATQAVLIQGAIMSVMDKKGGKAFKASIDKLTKDS